MAQNRKLKMLSKRIDFLRSAIAPARPLRIADIGANPINTPDYDNLLQIGGCEVWGFEPDKVSFDALMENPAKGTHYVQRAVGKSGEATFYPHPSSGLGSLFQIRKESVSYLGKPNWHQKDIEGIKIELVALDDLNDDILPKPDLLKIDIQGGELDVFQNGREKLSQAICVVPEVRFYRLYEGEPLLAATDAELHDQGFVLHKFLPIKTTVVRNSQARHMRSKVFRSQMIDGDAVYIRNPETINDWSDEQVKQLAIASAGMFDSFDLTVFCLDNLIHRGLVDAGVAEQFMTQLPPWMLEEGER